MMRVFVSDFETRTRHYPCQKTCGWIWTDFEFGQILSLIPVVGCLRQCWPSSTERGWERVKKEFLGERIKAWAVGSVRGSFEVEPTIRLGPGGCGPTFEAPDRPMQLRFPQTYRFPAFSYYPGTISVAKRILNLNCPLNFWVTDSFEVKIGEKVELSIFLHFPIHVEFGCWPSGLYRPAKFQLVAICLFKAIVKFDLIILHSEPGLFFKSICIWELLQ